MPLPFTAIMIMVFQKILSVLLSLAVSAGMITYETRGTDDPPADPSIPYVFETEDEYDDYYYTRLGNDLRSALGDGDEMSVIDRIVVKDGFTVCLCKNGTAAVTGVVLPMKTARFPSQVEGLPVVAIVNWEPSLDSFRANLHRCTSVIVPNTVEYISGPICFDTPYMQNIDLGERVRWVYSIAYMCAGLQRISFPASLERAGGLTLCLSLKEIEFCDGVRTVDGIDFCSALKSVRLPGTVTELGSDAFRNCTTLKDIYIPASVTEIDDYAMDSGREDLTIHGVKGSYAETWAAEHGCPFVADA